MEIKNSDKLRPPVSPPHPQKGTHCLVYSVCKGLHQKEGIPLSLSNE